jgi:hypothetical protein
VDERRFSAVAKNSQLPTSIELVTCRQLAVEAFITMAEAAVRHGADKSPINRNSTTLLTGPTLELRESNRGFIRFQRWQKSWNTSCSIPLFVPIGLKNSTKKPEGSKPGCRLGRIQQIQRRLGTTRPVMAN